MMSFSLSVELGFSPELSGRISLEGSFPVPKSIFIRTEVFLRIRNTMSFLNCFTMCLRRVSISVPGTVSFCLDCSFCLGQLETLEHLFLNCPFEREVWECFSPLFHKLLGDSNFVTSLQTLLALDFVEGFPVVTQKLAVYFLKLILHAIWHFRKMRHFEKVACTAQNAVSLVEFGFKQTCSKKFEFWQRELKLDKFKMHWAIGEVFCRVNRLDHLSFLIASLTRSHVANFE